MVCHLAMMVLYDVPCLHYTENVMCDQHWEDFMTRELIQKNCKEAKMVVIIFWKRAAWNSMMVMLIFLLSQTAHKVK